MIRHRGSLEDKSKRLVDAEAMLGTRQCECSLNRMTVKLCVSNVIAGLG